MPSPQISERMACNPFDGADLLFQALNTKHEFVGSKFAICRRRKQAGDINSPSPPIDVSNYHTSGFQRSLLLGLHAHLIFYGNWNP
jgi:hypothetical protein